MIVTWYVNKKNIQAVDDFGSKRLKWNKRRTWSLMKPGMAYVCLCFLLVYNKIILLHEGTIKIGNRNGTGEVSRNGVIIVQDLTATKLQPIFTLK